MSYEKNLIQQLIASGKTIATAESCTGGLVGKMLTDISGSSAAYLGGVVSYSNSVKNEVLGVPQKMLDTYGAVSKQVAAAMAEGVKKLIGADIAVSITGIAGPKSDDTKKPVGLVYIGVTDGRVTQVNEYFFSGDRQKNRLYAAQTAMNNAYSFLLQKKV